MAESSKHEYQIGGIKVEFPYKAYGPQLAYMGRIITTLDKAFRHPDGHCNALLESPTGSGKSLALLCAALSWQQHRKNDVVNPQTGPATQFGGGFIPEESTQAADDTKKLLARKFKTPTIFFATRTHSQISQIVQELRKTVYRVPMAILAARKHYCTNKHVCRKPNLDEECNILLKDPNKACAQFKNVHRLKGHTSLQQGGCQEVHDIEDLVNVARTVRGCAYFASRDMAQSANLVFCPYNYILNPAIRKAMAVDIRGDIIIFDEAHNIEDMSREAGSVDLTVSDLEELRVELEALSCQDDISDIYQPLLEIIQELLIWIREARLEKLDTDHFCGSWTGERAMKELGSFGVSVESFPVLLECAMKAAGAASDPDPDKNHLSGRAATVLEGLFSSLRFMLLKPEYMNDYQLVVQKMIQKDGVTDRQEWVATVSFWCLNPGVVFNEIATACKSVILTSGTLSPMSSFASELGVPFEILMEAPHVIDMNNQVCVNTVVLGPGNIPLNASYKCASTTTFQDALGNALEQIYNVVPGGALVFLPSYALLDRLCNRWKSTGQWNRFLSVKEVFVEPRGKAENFEHVLDSYYKAITGKAQGTGQKRGKSSFTERNGATFFAVCRGKVSEGINFSDDNARVVIVVGIPFPNVKDMQVSLKKQYNNAYRMSKNLLGGDQWYCQQAFRALNQAVGRCIRHRNDYGAILLIDERFNNSTNVGYMSRWLRKHIKVPQGFDSVLGDLRRFFEEKSLPLPSLASKSPASYQPCFETLFKKQENVTSSPIQTWQRENASEVPSISTPSPCQPWRKQNNQRSFTSSPQLRGKENIAAGSNMYCQIQEVSAISQNTYRDLDVATVSQKIEYAYSETQASSQVLQTSTCCQMQDLPQTIEDFTQSLAVDCLKEDILREDTVPCSLDMQANLQTQRLRQDGLNIQTQDPATKETDGLNIQTQVPATMDLNIKTQVPAASATNDEMLFCSRCENRLGPSAGCQISELQKTHLAFLVNRSVSVKVALMQSVLEGLVVDNRKSSSVWVEEDGCVFKNIMCSCCKAVIGAHIVAANLENSTLTGKFVLLLDFVKNTKTHGKRQSEIAAKGKLKLPKLK